MGFKEIMKFCGMPGFPHHDQRTMLYQYVPSKSQVHRIYFLSGTIHETSLPPHAIQCMHGQDQGKNREEELCIYYLSYFQI